MPTILLIAAFQFPFMESYAHDANTVEFRVDEEDFDPVGDRPYDFELDGLYYWINKPFNTVSVSTSTSNPYVDWGDSLYFPISLPASEDAKKRM